MNALRAVFVAPWPGWLAGAAIGALVCALLLARNRQLGVSFCYAHVADRLANRVGSRAREVAAAPTDAASEPSWPIAFLVGILLGGAASGLLARAVSGIPPAPIGAYEGFDALWRFGPAAKAGVLFAGGLLVGFGTRMAGGCTSGHALVGAPALQKASLAATGVFLGTGIVTARLLHWALER